MRVTSTPLLRYIACKTCVPFVPFLFYPAFGDNFSTKTFGGNSRLFLLLLKYIYYINKCLTYNIANNPRSEYLQTSGKLPVIIAVLTKNPAFLQLFTLVKITFTGNGISYGGINERI